MGKTLSKTYSFTVPFHEWFDEITDDEVYIYSLYYWWGVHVHPRNCLWGQRLLRINSGLCPQVTLSVTSTPVIEWDGSSTRLLLPDYASNQDLAVWSQSLSFGKYWFLLCISGSPFVNRIDFKAHGIFLLIFLLLLLEEDRWRN